MKYNIKDIPVIDKHFSYKVDTIHKRILCQANGEIKILECEPDIFMETLNYIDGSRSFEDIENLFVLRFSKEEIRAFLDILINECIISKGTNKGTNKKGNFKVVVVGSGKVFENLRRRGIECVSQKYFKKNEHIYDYDFLIYSPEKETYNDLMNLNKVLYKKRKPYFPVYFDGQRLIFGPLIVPEKTCCLECLISSELRTINFKLDDSSKLGVMDIENLNFCHELNDSINEEAIDFIISIILDDFNKIKNGNASEFLDKRFVYYNNSIYFKKEKTQPTTYCNFCHGMNNNYVKYGTNLSIENILSGSLNVNKEKICENNIKYKIGGYRTKTEEETSKILQKELDKIGAKIKIEESKGNPFNDSGVVHCYNAIVEQSYNKDKNLLYRNNSGAGKGITQNQSFFSAAFELLEHMSLEYSGNVPIISARYKDIKNNSIDLGKLLNTIKNKNTSFGSYNENDEIDWVIAKSLVNEKNILVPAFMVFMYDIDLKGIFFPISSSGAAIGTTLEDAILHGLLESVERDSWLICQSNPYVMPILDYSSIKNKKIKEIIYGIKNMGYNIITRDYTTDLGIPTYRTWIWNKDDYSRYAYNGLGCHLDGELALERSITEAVQVDDWSITGGELEPDMITLEVLDRSLINVYNQHYLINKDIFGETDKILPVRHLGMEYRSSYQCINILTKLIKEKTNGDILYVDLSKKEMDIKTVRTIITGDFQQMNIPLISVSDRLLKFGINCGFSNKMIKYENLFMGKYAH